MPVAVLPQHEPRLAITTEKVCRIILKARQYDVKVPDTDPDSGSNASDDDMRDVLMSTPDDPVRRELMEYIARLDVEEQVHLVALAWLGRGTYDLSEWHDAVETARGEHNNRTAHYLLGLPLLGDYLEEGLSAFGQSCGDSGTMTERSDLTG